MTSAAVQKKSETAPKAMAKTPVAKKVPRLIKWSEFEKRYLSREDGYQYCSHNLVSMTVCMGEKICSADPVLPAFAFPVSDIFKKATEEDK